MALVVPRRLFNATLRSKSLDNVLTRSYRSNILTKTSLNYPRLVTSCSVPSLNSGCDSSYDLHRKFSSSIPKENIEGKNGGEERKLSLFQRFKQMYRDYWYVLVPVHLVTSAAWFGGFYYMASSGVDVPALLESMNFSEKVVNSMRNSSMGYVAITYGLYKIATPARYAVTLGGTTLSINYLKKWGYIKPIPSKERLKEIYAETKEGMKEKKESLIEGVHHLQQTVKDTKQGIKHTRNSIVSSVKGSKESIRKIKRKVVSRTSQKNEDKP